MTGERKIYIQAAEQISMQQPLSHEWLDTPLGYDGRYVRSIDPNYRDYLSPIESRRLGKVLKRALVTSLSVLKDTATANPDAILTGTGLGCVENTEAFLKALCTDGEHLLKPTHFMQSTHNTIGSLIAIHTHTHGYNVTYSHKSVSFESALLDAVVQLRLRTIDNALVGSHDEVTPSYYTLLERIGYVGQPGQVPCGEASVAMMVGGGNGHCLCELAGIEMLYRSEAEDVAAAVGRLLSDSGLLPGDIDVVMTGENGSSANDRIYDNLCNGVFAGIRRARYKHVFGECYSASALGVYAAARCLSAGRMPGFLAGNDIKPLHNVLFANHSDGKDFSFILLRKCGD